MMSSDYYGSIAGEIADKGAREEMFEAWLNEYTRGEAEPGRTPADELRAAFIAGSEAGPGCSFTREGLIGALAHLEIRVPTSGPDAGKVNAESMADALIEALKDGAGS